MAAFIQNQPIQAQFQEDTNMEIFSIATALFQFLASLMSLLSRFPLMG